MQRLPSELVREVCFYLVQEADPFPAEDLFLPNRRPDILALLQSHGIDTETAKGVFEFLARLVSASSEKSEQPVASAQSICMSQAAF